MNKITIRGARQHNLKDLSLQIPKDKFVVVTGPSGCGKSSLAFHTLYAEGQRRYVESLSAYARQFLEQLEKPDVDGIEGLSPAIAIDQKAGSGNPRSTVATTTEIYDYLRVLYSAAGVPHDPVTGEKLEKMTSADIVEALAALPQRSKVILLAPVASSETENPKQLMGDIRRQGFVRVRINGEIIDAEEAEASWPDQLESFEVVVDRLAIREEVNSRIADSVETGLRICGQEALALVQEHGADSWSILSFSTSYRNANTGFKIGTLSPQDFSFNSHKGACEICHGLGTKLHCDPSLIVPDQNKSLDKGAIQAWGGSKKNKEWINKQVDAITVHFSIDRSQCFAELPAAFKECLFYGSKSQNKDTLNDSNGVPIADVKKYEGLCNAIERIHDETSSDQVRRGMSRYMASQACEACGGKRLKPHILSVKLDSHGAESLGIQDLCGLAVEDALTWVDGVVISDDKLAVAGELIREVRERLKFLDEVGLGYLSLDRKSSTLSGGESQRIRLATQIGAGLSGVIYVLDEPSIGLHQDDNLRLINALKRLRKLGNTVIVVEHDEETIRAADWVIDMGPCAGKDGGYLVAQGTPQQIAQNEQSLTGLWLNSAPSELSRGRRHDMGELKIHGASEHNLAGFNVVFPLGQIVCVTGPSGSGKSTLTNTILKRSLARHFHGAKAIPGAHDGIDGMEQLDRVIVVDQSPLGRSPRSNPATYTGALDHIRALFAKLPLSRQRGYKSGRFSFNVRGGRCEKCQGDGKIKIDMHFLTDAYVPCDSCNGLRFNRETLEVTYKGKNMAEVLSMSADQALAYFAAIPKLEAILRSLCEVGLGYIQLGQAANTLSGGEAQRVKLATELAKRSPGHALYLLDEPTTGLHHGDVEVLMKVLKKLRDEGNSLIVVEHNLDVIRGADWVVDLGPGGGKYGGQLVAACPPAQLAEYPASLTGKSLARC